MDKGGRRLCEYPYCKNYAENKGIRNGENRYRPWCEKHRYVKIRAKRYAGKSAVMPAVKPKPKAKPAAKAKPKAKPAAKPKARVRRGPRRRRY